MTLTKAELADILVEKVSSISKHDAKEIVELFFEEIRTTLERGEEIKNFRFWQLPTARQTATPRAPTPNRRRSAITARRVVTFHASQKLKGMVEHLHDK